MMDEMTTSYPKNMSYHFNRIMNYSKIPVKINCDRTGAVNHNETIRFKLPTNSLVNLDSLVWSFDFTTVKASTNAGTSRLFPRNSASIIDTLSIYINGVLVDNIVNYNHLFNLLSDHLCGKDYNGGMRDLENTDPSVTFKYNDVNGQFDPFVTTQDAHTNDDSDKNKRLQVTSWLGFLGSCSTRIIDTSLLGEVIIEIKMSDPTITFKSAANATDVAASYTIDGSKTVMTIDRISFGDSNYYDMLKNIVMNSGLKVAYKTYNSHRGSTFTKQANKTETFQFLVNANHLTKLIGTTMRSDYKDEGILLNNSQSSSFETQKNTILNVQQMFNQSRYFQKECSGLGTVQFEINNVSMYPAPIDYYDIIYNNQNALNTKNDRNAGVHPGMVSYGHFLSTYFAHILSLEHIQDTSDFVVQGLNGEAAPINCRWTLNFKGAGVAGDLIPLVFSERQQIMNISAGQQLQIM
jgi:hypothetical protein